MCPLILSPQYTCRVFIFHIPYFIERKTYDYYIYPRADSYIYFPIIGCGVKIAIINLSLKTEYSYGHFSFYYTCIAHPGHGSLIIIKADWSIWKKTSLGRERERFWWSIFHFFHLAVNLSFICHVKAESTMTLF